jgi:type VI protein secretion system component VasF
MPDLRPEPDRTDDHEERTLARTLFWIGFGVGVVALAVGITFTTLRLASRGRREDPTTQRIQELIDEANSLLKALDEQRHSA